MENCDCNLSVTTLIESEDFIKKNCNIDSVEDILQELLGSWLYEWNDFNDISIDIYEKVKDAHKILLQNCTNESYSEGLQISLECLILSKLHDHIVPLICYTHAEEDELFHNKCKSFSNLNVTAEQLGAPEDYAIPLAAAVVEFATLDTHRSPVEKIHCLCTTFDLVFAELKTAIVEIISKSSGKDENKIPVIENRDVIPILMIVIIKSKLLHLHANMYYIDNFLWKLHESEHVQNTIAVFKKAITQIHLLNEKDLRPSSGKVYKDLDLANVTNLMAKIDVSSTEETESLLENHLKRITKLIFTSTNSNNGS